MPRRKKSLRISIGILIAVALAGYGVLILTMDPWVSPAREPREFGDTEFFTEAETPIPTSPPTLKLDEVQRKMTKKELSFIWEDRRPRWRRSQIGRIPPRITADEKRVITLPDGGKIRLGWAVTGYQPNLSDFPDSKPYTPTMVIARGDSGAPLDEAAFRKYQETELGFENSVAPWIYKWRAGRFSLDLHFLHEGIPDLLTIGNVELMNRDTNTKVDWNSGGNINSFREGTFSTNPAIEVFTPSQLAASFDIAYGPLEEVTLPLIPGERATLSGVEMEILSIERFAYSSGQRSAIVKRSKNEETRSTSFNLDLERDPQTAIIFSISPPEMGPFCDFVLVNKDGDEEIKTVRQTYRVDYLTTKTLPEDLAEIRIRYRPNQARVVFNLPRLRGVPVNNENLDNLFDVTIPHLSTNDAWDIERAISTHADVDMLIPDPEFPADYFPRFYENTTPRELLEEYLVHHPQRHQIKMDHKSLSITIPKPIQFKDLWKDFRNWLR